MEVFQQNKLIAIIILIIVIYTRIYLYILFAKIPKLNRGLIRMIKIC